VRPSSRVITCLDVFDFARAWEWTEEIDRLEQNTIAAGFPGDCRTHRAELHIVGGRGEDGEREAGLVCAADGALERSHTITAWAIIGEVRLRQGDLDGAASAFARVTPLGGLREPGSSLLLLARGEVEGAAMSILVALSGTADRCARARLLRRRSESPWRTGTWGGSRRCRRAGGDRGRCRNNRLARRRDVRGAGSGARGRPGPKPCYRYPVAGCVANKDRLVQAMLESVTRQPSVSA
jgi:hypothetical protein